MMPDRIPALIPRGQGYQFLIYGDACSGVPGALHEQTFASVNAVVRRLHPQPEFILFPGDEIIGLAPDAATLREQWLHWLDVETAWLDRTKVPMWHTTGNHTTYDTMSEAVFRDVLKLPDNGPADQIGLSYFVRRDELLMVFVNTLWSGLGGEGHVETQWLEKTLKENSDARHKLVLGHHPVFPVNGFSGPYQREIGPEHSAVFWDILVREKVLVYICSHILAFDVQVNRGVLQICTAGAGTAHRMPEGAEYLHCVQAAIDGQGFRFQVLDTEGTVREQLAWPPPDQYLGAWRPLRAGEDDAQFQGQMKSGQRIELRLTGQASAFGHAAPQTIFSACAPDFIAPVWIGFRGAKQTLTAIIGGISGRSPSYWIGPDVPPDSMFDLHLAFHADMGPGGVLYRHHQDQHWTSFSAATAKGISEIAWPSRWVIGHGQGGTKDRPYMGRKLDCQAWVSHRS